ncbi:MAG: HAD family hydrolase [Planctomycetes bacterium]|nr:HAD family hydrolase [Planctomycetota bacterium]
MFNLNLGKLTDPIIRSILFSSEKKEVIPLVDKILRATERYSQIVLDECLSVLEARELINSPVLEAYLKEESDWRLRPTGAWLVARILELRGLDSYAISAWDQVLNRGEGPIYQAHLSRSWACYRVGDIANVFSNLHKAIDGQHHYGFLSKASKLFSQLRAQGNPPSVRKIRLALLSSTTTDLAAPILQLACFREWIDAELYVAPYGNLRQEILDPASGLYAFGPDFVIMAFNWRDANLPSFVENPDTHVKRVVSEFEHLWQTLLQRRACHIILHNFDIPCVDSYGHLGGTIPGGVSHTLREINRRLLELVPSTVTVLDLERVSAIYGKHRWFDTVYWHLAKQYPSAEALPWLVNHQVALLRAALGLSKKVLVLDLDNTLWGGVIGEDGLSGIRLGPPSAVGEAYQAFQKYALELKERGVLLVVCSKNNLEDAQLPFLRHDATVLHLEDFAIFRANWFDKTTNLREIANKLNLGLDSFVFLDDNPVERALVRGELPEIAVPELAKDPSTFVDTLERGLYFESLTLSQEDRERHQSYRANVLRDDIKTASGSLDEFLANLNMEAEIGSFNEGVLTRVVQLIGKTNQFNLTTRRHSEELVRRTMASEEYWTQYFKLRDRFGDNGLIGIVIAHQIPVAKKTWEIDTWLMSCRVIGRGMEHFMLRTLIEAARAKGVKNIIGVYIPTLKNTMVSELYPQLGFEKLSETDSELSFILDIETHKMLAKDFIRISLAEPSWPIEDI